MGTHISKVRSIELDQHIWTVTLIEVCCLHGMYIKAGNKCITVIHNIMGVRNLCISRVSFMILAVHSTVLFQNWYLFTYSGLAYSHFTHFKPIVAFRLLLTNDTKGYLCLFMLLGIRLCIMCLMLSMCKLLLNEMVKHVSNDAVLPSVYFVHGSASKVNCYSYLIQLASRLLYQLQCACVI